ncbi:hypothetical protein ACFU76_18010 [Streptomyces sp. NPDC057539]|uniref:hypothetical protein n=1 Tax=Streptomyces sp. NPDC057539 TaxID=3346159 RepID=UPI0036A260A3
MWTGGSGKRIPADRPAGGLPARGRRRRQLVGQPGQLCDHFARWAALPTTTASQVADHGRALELVAELAEEQGRPDLAPVPRSPFPAMPESPLPRDPP